MLTGKTIRSYCSSATSVIRTSATILTFREQQTVGLDSTDATVTLAPALLKTSMMVTASISSEPSPMGTSTVFSMEDAIQTRVWLRRAAAIGALLRKLPVLVKKVTPKDRGSWNPLCAQKALDDGNAERCRFVPALTDNLDALQASILDLSAY